MPHAPRVLLVDDEPATVRHLTGALADEGYELLSAGSGAEALDTVASHRPDLVLLDIGMPPPDGFAVLERIKADVRTRLIPVVMVTGCDRRATRLRAVGLGADDFLNKPVDLAALRARVRALLRLKRHVDELEHAENVLLSLARAVEARDPGLAEHCARMTELVGRVAERLGLPPADRPVLRMGARFHDIGKIGIPDAVLQKAGLLTPAERVLVRTHPVVGEEILRPLTTLAPVLALVRGHHERLDGSGYPDGLRGDQIPRTVRILSAVDVYDSLTSVRPYRPAMTPDGAMALLQDEARSGYWDARVVDALAAL